MCERPWNVPFRLRSLLIFWGKRSKFTSHSEVSTALWLAFCMQTFGNSLLQLVMIAFLHTFLKLNSQTEVEEHLTKLDDSHICVHDRTSLNNVHSTFWQAPWCRIFIYLEGDSCSRSQVIFLVMDSADSLVCFKEASSRPWYHVTWLHHTPSNPVCFHISVLPYRAYI